MDSFPLNPNQRYTTDLLGMPFPEVRFIWIGECPGKEIGHYVPSHLAYAHAHLCKDDKLYGSICINRAGFIFNADGSVSDLMWHEYGHIIDFKYIEYVWAHEEHSHVIPGSAADNLQQDRAHGEDWQNIMRKLGKEQLAQRYLPAGSIHKTMEYSGT